MQKKKVPTQLWDYGLVYEGELLSKMSRGQDGRSGYEMVTGNTPDINEWLDFEFYDLVWWIDWLNKPNVNDVTEKWLGVSHRVGSDLCYWLVTDSGQVASKTLVEHVTRNDYLHEDTRKRIKKFNNEKLEECLDDTNFILQGENGVDLKFLEDLVENDGINAMAEGDNMPIDEEYGDMLVDECPNEDEEAMDKYLNMELTMGVGTDDER
jgi:hypothetical protein